MNLSVSTQGSWINSQSALEKWTKQSYSIQIPLKYEMVPVKLDGYAVVIMNTNKRRELADSKYNERRSECEEALKRLQTQLAIDALGDLDSETFEAHTDLINDDTLIRRARHAVTENQRTLEAKAELEKGNLAAFGKIIECLSLLIAS